MPSRVRTPRLQFLDEEGRFVLAMPSARSRSRVASYWNAVWQVTEFGREDALLEFEGRWIMANGRRHYFVTDLEVLEEFGFAGELQFEELYDH